MQRSRHKNLAREMRIQRSCASGPTGSWRRDPDRKVVDNGSAYRDLAQVVLQDPDEDVLTERSCTRDSHTEILHK